jgi:hypothetical protein
MHRQNHLRFFLACISMSLLMSMAISTFEPWIFHQDAVCPTSLLELELEGMELDGDEKLADWTDSVLLHCSADSLRPLATWTLRSIEGAIDLVNQASSEQHRQRPPPVCS